MPKRPSATNRSGSLRNVVMNLRNCNVVVTGGAGLIGSFLTERLVSVGAKVVVADDFSKGKRQYIAAVIDKVEIREGDLEQSDAMARALTGADIVFHLASRAYGIGHSSGNHIAILEHNERITNNLVHELARRPVARLVVASSSCVYPDDGPDTLPELPLWTGEPEAANWGYGWAKRILEQKVDLLARETGMPLTIVRPFNIYGERYTWVGNASQAIPMQVKKIMDGDDPVLIWGSGTQRRNYLACLRLCRRDRRAGGTRFQWRREYRYRRYGDLARTGGDDLRGCRTQAASGDRHEQARGAPRQEFVLGSAEAGLSGFRQTIDLKSGLARMIDWYRAEFGEKVA